MASQSSGKNWDYTSPVTNPVRMTAWQKGTDLFARTQENSLVTVIFKEITQTCVKANEIYSSFKSIIDA
jgi:hypothetical protein